jgi:hypothetical protein
LPEDYPLFRAAKYLGVAPWVLAEQNIFWQERALFFQSVEQEAEAELAKRGQE